MGLPNLKWPKKYNMKGKVKISILPHRPQYLKYISLDWHDVKICVSLDLPALENPKLRHNSNSITIVHLTMILHL